MATSYDYLKLLETWVQSARRQINVLPGHPEIASYGPGNHGHWAQQTNNTALGAFAELAVNPLTDCTRTGMSREQLLELALSLLRFTIFGHLSGEGACVDGEKWGHSWISNLCVERMMHAVESLEPFMNDHDKNGIRNLLVSEADWLVDSYPVAASLTPPGNKPESNMWNGAVLWRTALRYPDAPRANEYREKGTKLLLNAMSFPQDASSEQLFEGKPLREWHVGANFFESAACNHHGYMNVGYINITLSNLAMLHFSGKHYGWKLPDALYLHLKDVWPLTKTCLFPDGRLLRIGGDSRVRYCYCQDYALLGWMMIRDILGDTDTAAFEDGWLKQVATEQNANPDGSFLGTRLASLEFVSPLYYTRLEGDKAATLAMAACWHRRFDDFKASPIKPPQPLLTNWSDDYHGSLFVRSPRRTASWTWIAAERPMGLCIPTAVSNLAEWRYNMSGQIQGMGVGTDIHTFPLVKRMFPGGFITSGHTITQSISPLAEGEANDNIACTKLAFAALPDDATVIAIQHAVSLNRFNFRTVKGLFLNIPNDVFNRKTRMISAEFLKQQSLLAPPRKAEKLSCGSWLNIDGILGVRSFGKTQLFINRPSRPQVAIKTNNGLIERAGGQSYAEEVCAGCCFDNDFPRCFEPNDVLFDVACAVRTNVDARQTQEWANDSEDIQIHCSRPEDLRSVVTRGVDNRFYAVVFNIGTVPIEVTAVHEHRLLQPEEAAVMTLNP